MTTFLRLLDASIDEKPEALLRAVTSVRSSERPPQLGGEVFDCDPELFAAVPGSPFSYWVSNTMRAVFTRNDAFNSGGRVAAVGIQTSDDFRFLRLAWETRNPDFAAFAKGGAFSPFYSPVNLRLQWRRDGAELKSSVEARYGTASKHVQNQRHYFRSGLTWPSRTNGLSFRVLPKSCIFGHKGPTAFVDGDAPAALLSLCALMNSRCFEYLVSIQLARTELAQSYEVGLIQQTPVPKLSKDDSQRLAALARQAWSLKRSLDTTIETSHAFLLPPDVNEKVTGLDRAGVDRKLGSIQREIDGAAFGLYGINTEDRAAIEASSKRATSSTEASEAEDDGDDSGDDGAPVGAASDVQTAWLVGVAFGRFDPRLATGDRAPPLEPEPFDPLPSRSPGMYPEGQEPADLPDILVGDEGHPDDLVARVGAAADRVRVDTPENLRAWLSKEFFPLHIKMYSKSRRKAPIYWQLATPSATYSVWLYIHALSKDTLFRVQNDYAAPKLAHEERRLESLNRELRDKPTAAQRKEASARETVVEELRALLEDVRRVAPLWNPNLDDGVVISFAPLWRLVPQHKPWQKELKATWDALCEGTYDWAHLAMHLWPERVVPKCARDRSLAIAHSLEEVFWVEGSDGKWTARKTPTRSEGELVRERASPAVKAALKALLEAPTAGGSGGKSRGKRRPSAADAEGES